MAGGKPSSEDLAMKSDKANTRRATRHKGHWNDGPLEASKVGTYRQGHMNSLVRDRNSCETKRRRMGETQS